MEKRKLSTILSFSAAALIISHYAYSASDTRFTFDDCKEVSEHSSTIRHSNGHILSISEDLFHPIDNKRMHVCRISFRYFKETDDSLKEVRKNEESIDKAGIRNIDLLMDGRFKSDMCSRIMDGFHNGARISKIRGCYTDDTQNNLRLTGYTVGQTTFHP